MANSRDSWKMLIFKLFLCGLVSVFFLIGAVKNLLYGRQVPARDALPSAAGSVSPVAP